MSSIHQLPPMAGSDAVSVGFAQFNTVPHLPVDIPDGGFTITTKTSDGRRTTFYFGPYETGGTPQFIDIQFHDRGTTIPAANGEPTPTFDTFTIGKGGHHPTDSRPLAEPDKPSILVLLLEPKNA